MAEAMNAMHAPLVLLDGGIGHLLKAKGVERLAPGLQFDQLFVAGALANQLAPDAVTEVHEAYIAAGADVITTNTFGCTQWSLGRVGRADAQAELVVAAGRLARAAANEANEASGRGRQVLVAGSLPPLRESYQASGLAAFEEMQPEYHLLAGLLKPHVDLLLCETLATVTEGVAAGSAAAASGLPWWASWTLEDSERAVLRSGEPLQDAVAAVVELPGLEAVLVNCCCPQAVAAALPVLAAAAPPGVRIGGSANGFRTTTTEWLTGGSSSAGAACALPAEEYDPDGLVLPEAYVSHAQRWVASGASVVGGCCGVGPQHVAALAGRLRSGGSSGGNGTGAEAGGTHAPP